MKREKKTSEKFTQWLSDNWTKWDEYFMKILLQLYSLAILSERRQWCKIFHWKHQKNFSLNQLFRVFSEFSKLNAKRESQISFKTVQIMIIKLLSWELLIKIEFSTRRNLSMTFSINFRVKLLKLKFLTMENWESEMQKKTSTLYKLNKKLKKFHFSFAITAIILQCHKSFYL